MRKITMMVAGLALLLGSCVTNQESDSVTNIRNAKADQLKSIAALNNAEAAAATVLAQADAALKAAQAKAEEAKAKEAEANAALVTAKIENEKLIAEAEAALLKAEAALKAAEAALKAEEAALKAEEVAAAKAELEAVKAEAAARIAQAEAAKALAEKEKAQYIADMEKAVIDAKAALALAQQQLATAEQNLKNELERIEAENTVVVDVMALFNAYQDLALDLVSAQITLADYKASLATAEKQLVSVQEAAAAAVEAYEADIVTYKQEAAWAQVRLEKLQSFVTVDVEELEAQYAEIDATEKVNTYNDYVLANQTYYKVGAAQADAISDVNTSDWVSTFSSNPFGAEVFQVGYMNAAGEDLTQAYYEYESYCYNWATSWDELEAALADWLASNGAFEVYGVYKEGDADPVTGEVAEVFVPIFGAHVAWAQEQEVLEYELASGVTGEYTYGPMTGVGFIDVAAMKARIAAVKADFETGNEAYLKNYQERVDKAQADADLWAGVVKAATAWYDAYVEADLAHKYANVNSRYLVSLKDGYLRDEDGNYIPTALYAYNQAVNTEKSAQTAYDAALAKVNDLKDILASLEEKEVRWDLEDAIEPLVKPAKETADALAKAEKELVAAEKVLAEKEAALVKAEAALEAAEVKERVALKAWEAAVAVVTEAGAEATQAQKDAEKAAKEAYDKAVEATAAASTALAEAEIAVVTEEGKVAVAEAAVADAEVAAEVAAAALKAAQDALADLDVAIAEVKKHIAWAEEDAVAPAAALEEAKAATVAAEAVLKAAKVAAEETAAVLATGDLQRAYEVALAGKSGYGDPEDAWYYAVENYKNAVANVEYYKSMMVLDDSFDQMVEQWLALVDEAEAAFAEATELVAAVNDALKATGEAYIAMAKAYDVYELVMAELNAISDVLDENESVTAAIASIEAQIERYNTSIENCEAEIAKLTDPNANINYELIIAVWTEKVELQETYVELLTAEVAAAKAEFEAATKAE